MNSRQARLASNGACRTRLGIGSCISERETLAKLAAIGVSGFETLLECGRRQVATIGRLQRYGCKSGEHSLLNECDAQGCGDTCNESCHFATRERRIQNVFSAYTLMHGHPGPIFDVCVVHPRWERAVGDLVSTNIQAAAQWNRRRLKSLCQPRLVAVGIYEVSLNVELNGETFWAGEIHEVVAGAEQKALREAFEIECSYRRKRARNRLVQIEPVENLGARLAYSTKRFVEQRVAYISKSNKRQNRRHLPPKELHWAEHEAWLASLRIGGRTIAFGCRRVDQRFITTTGGSRYGQ